MFQMLTKLLDKVKSIINFPANDPYAPLVITHQIPDLPNPCPPFVVQGFTGQSGPPNSQQWQAAGVYTMITNSLKFIQQQSAIPLTKWARTSNLIAVPRAGNQLNAYYDGSTLRFFFKRNNKDRKYIFTCESSDVVCHELGHAVLDALRPDLWTTQGIEIFAFHESFGDMNSILAALNHNEIIDFILKETGGDLKKPNMVSKLAEEMGSAITRTDSLRNAVNQFKYTNPDKLPNSASNNDLSKEPHNFSRVFTGAFYDIIVNQFEFNSSNLPQKDALILARDQAGALLYNSVLHAANTPAFFDSVVRSMIVTDEQRGGQCRNSIYKVFTERGILQPTPLMVTASKIENRQTKVFRHKHGNAVRVGGVKTVKLINEMIVTQSENPLYAVNVDIPNEHYVEYDENGCLKVDRPIIRDQTLGSVKTCLDFLHTENKVSYDNNLETDREFSVVDGKLIRNYICCKH